MTARPSPVPEPRAFRLLETILWEPGEGFFLLEGHLRRLAASAGHWGFACDPARVRAGLAKVASELPERPHRVRLTLDRSGGIEVRVTPLPADASAPARVALSADPVDRSDPLLRHKTTHREVYRVRAAARPDCDDVILTNDRGEVTESTIANVVIVIEGEAWTPPLDAGLLPGVFREHLLRTGQVRERSLRPDDLRRAEALYLVNSVRRWRPATLV